MAKRVVSRKTIEGRWTCPACGTENQGRYRLCQSCGTPRGSTKVDLPDAPETAPTMTHDEFRHLADSASGAGTTHMAQRVKGAFEPVPSASDSTDTSDWICEYCGASNGSWRSACISCGNPRDGHEVTYHEVTRHAKETGLSREDAEADLRHSREYGSDGSPDHATDQANQSDDAESVGSLLSQILGIARRNGRRLTVAGLALVALVAVIWMLVPHPRDITPESFDWSRNIGISELRTVREDDWSVPAGGREYDRKLEYHYDRKVHDGYHTEEYTDYERQKTGTRTWTEYEDNGDGSYDAVTYEEDVYEDVPVTRTREVEDYHYEPVYDTKYYYEIERWQHSRDISTSGTDQSPYWGDVVLSDATGRHGTGKEKEDGRTEEYGVTCEDGRRYTADLDFWKRLEKGGKVTVLLHSDGRIEEYKR